MKNKSRKLHWKIINGISAAFIVVLLLFTIISLNVNKDFDNGFFGYKFFIVKSDSMKPEFQAGDIVVTKVVDISSLKKGNVITYYVGDGTVVTHQIYDKVDGKFITKGINVDQADDDPVYPSEIIGKYSYALPKAGKIVAFLKTQTGFILCIMIPMFLIMMTSGFQFFNNLNKYIRDKKEKRNFLLNKEIEKNKKLIEELKYLKAQGNIENNHE